MFAWKLSIRYHKCMNMIMVPRKLMRKSDLLVVEKDSFRRLTKENIELRRAIKAVISGELDLRRGRTRPFRAFLKGEFPLYAQNK